MRRRRCRVSCPSVFSERTHSRGQRGTYLGVLRLEMPGVKELFASAAAEVDGQKRMVSPGPAGIVVLLAGHAVTDESVTVAFGTLGWESDKSCT